MLTVIVQIIVLDPCVFYASNNHVLFMIDELIVMEQQSIMNIENDSS